MTKRLAVLMTILLSGATSTATPLTTETVVKLFAGGSSTERIVATIEQSEPNFDLSPEMLRELRSAHVPERVIRAMQLRQQRATPLPDETSNEVGDGQTLATLTLQGSRLSLGRSVPEALANRWELGNTSEERTFTDLAIYVVCLSSEHVPNHWRSHSPLGRDFDSMQRHRLVGFYSAGDDQTARKLRFELPETIDLVFPDEAPHDLAIGIAAHAGGAFRRITDDVWTAVSGAMIESGLGATASGGSLESLRVRFTDKPADSREVPDATGTDARIKRPREP